MKKIINKLFNYQGMRFLFVGGLNTIVGYGIYALLVYFNMNYLIANTVSTIIGVIHSYFWNRFFTFKSKQKALKEITKFVSVYAASYVIGMCTLYIFKSKLDISPYIAGLLNLVITTLISYFGHKYISFRNGNTDMKELFNKFKDKYLNIKKAPTKLEWGILITILIFCYLSFNHGDITATSTHGRDLLELTLQGKFFSFYDYTKATAVYLIPIYILFAVWSIPVFIVYGIFNIKLWGILDYGGVNFYLLMWYKLLPTIFTILTAKLLVKIAKEIGLSEVKQKWLLFIYFSSPLIIFPQFIFGQYDSICMFLTTLSLCFYLKKDYIKFSIIMSIAMTFKLFPIFLFIPLILLVEKRLFHMAKYFLIGIFGTVLSNLMFYTSPAFKEAKSFTTGMIDRFFMSEVNMFFGVMSLFLVIFMGICVYCYNKKFNKDDKVEYISNTLYICLAIYSLLFAFVAWHPQWIIILAPFLILSLFINENSKTTLILYLAISVTYLLLTFYMFFNNVDEILIDKGIIKLLFENNMKYSGVLGKFYIKYLSKNMCMTVFAGSLIINLITKFPNEKNLKLTNKIINEKNLNFEKGYILMQILPIFMFIIPTLFLFFIYYK